MTDKSLQAHDMSDVLEMAREAGFTGNELKYISNKKYEAFANLIRADEREQCAELCKGLLALTCFQKVEHYAMAKACEESILNRGE
jgi:hypothetical protein